MVRLGEANLEDDVVPSEQLFSRTYIFPQSTDEYWSTRSSSHHGINDFRAMFQIQPNILDPSNILASITIRAHCPLPPASAPQVAAGSSS